MRRGRRSVAPSRFLRASVLAAPMAGSTEPTFTSEQERAQRAIEEFEKVAAKYGDPYRSEALYFIAANRLSSDRPKGISELTELTNSSVAEVAALSKFALGASLRERRQTRRSREALR